MVRTGHRIASVLTLLVTLVVAGGVASRASEQDGAGAASSFPSTKNGEWPHYNGDVRGSRYSPLDQINASNFNSL